MEAAGSSILRPVPSVNFGFYSLLREELAPNGRCSLLELCAPPEAWRWSLTPRQGRCGVTGQRPPHPLLETLRGSPLI